MSQTRKKKLSAVIVTFLLAMLLALTPFLNTPSVQARSAIHLASTNYASLVDPFTGTGMQSGSPGGYGGGQTFPGADAPFGMVQWSPDTVNDSSGGYDYNDYRIRGFSLTHLNGAGCDAYEDIPFIPYIGTVTNSPATDPSQYYTTLYHPNEKAYAGYYKVALDNGITTEITTTQRTGAMRLTYPAGKTATLLINSSGSIKGVSNAQTTISGNTISGFATSQAFCGAGNKYTIYFSATFSQTFASSGTWQNGTVTSNNSVSGTGSGAYVTFNTSSNAVITANVGISFVSVANAQANLSQENPSGNFDTVLAQSTQTWNNYLGEVQVSGGTSAQTATFYTAMYHALLQPNVFSDDNGQYIGFDNQTHTVSSGHAQYANISGWDVYRSEMQLLAFLAPSQASDIAQSMVNDYTQSGQLPKWGFANAETYVLAGDPADAMLAEIYAFGGTNFDTSTALSAMVKEATQTNNIRPGLNYLTSQGYLPLDGTYGCCGFSGAAATTLEYNIADFSIATFAQALGNTSDYQQFVNRAQDWQNLVNSNDKYLEPRNANGSFPALDLTSTTGWNEGDTAQYSWMVPFNLKGLFQALGGNSAVVSRLNTFFTQLNGGISSPYAYLGNEPSWETPWLYDYAGAPYQTQNVVRQAENTLFSTGSGGLPGNDDLGQTSSWYVWAAMGMFPETPGTANLALSSPLFPNISIHRPSGQTITINAPNASSSTYYVQSLNVNGSASNNPWLPPSFIANGGTLDYTLSTSANTSWGSDPSNAPPSYGGSASISSFSTSFDNGQPQPTWTNTADTTSPGGGLTNVGGICCSLTGPEMVPHNENAHTGSSALLYSGMDTSSSSSYAYLKVFDFSGQNLTVGSSTTLTYWIFPQSPAGNTPGANLTSGNNSSCVAVDLIFSDNTSLRDSGATDQHGNRAHPMYQCGHLTMDTWNQVTVNLGSVANGKTIVRLDVGYDQPANSGGYRGYLDDISIG